MTMFEWIKSKLRVAEPAARAAAGESGEATRSRMLGQTEAFHDEGAVEQARQHCLALLRLFPNDARALCLMAEIAADARQTEEGLQWAQRAAAADPRAASPHYLAGRMLQAEGRLTQAESSYHAALTLAPDHARTHTNLGCVLHMQGKLDVALA